MTTSRTRRRTTRRFETSTGPRVLVQIPRDQEVIPGWLRYELLAIGPEPGQTLRLTLYERAASPGWEDPRAA